jgi:hypothetical protein
MLVKIQTVDSMTSCVDRFRPETIQSFVLIKHSSCDFYESPILRLHYPFLLQCVWDREFMTNSFTIKILFNVGILELGAIVTSYSLDLHINLILGSGCKLVEYIMNLILVTQK